jgi:hypothetical protein
MHIDVVTPLLAPQFFSAKVWQHTVVKGASDGDFFCSLEL